MKVFPLVFSTLMFSLLFSNTPVHAVGDKVFAKEIIDIDDIESKCKSNGFLSALAHGDRETIASYMSSNVNLRSFNISPLTCTLLNRKTPEVIDMVETLINREEIDVHGIHVFLARNLHNEELANFLQEGLIKEEPTEFKIIVGSGAWVRWERLTNNGDKK